MVILVDPFNRKVLDNSLVTVNILYFLPDYKNIIQTFTWQTNDIRPKYPKVHKFLNFWQKEIEAVIAEVQIADSTGYRIANGIEIKDKFFN